MSRFHAVLLAALLAFGVSAGPATAAEKSKYDDIIQNAGLTQTIKSLGMFCMAAPHEEGSIKQQVAERWWVRHPDVELSESGRELAAVDFERQFEVIKRMSAKHGIRRLVFAGFTQIGSLNNIDIYYAADTARGPVLFRVTLALQKTGLPYLHQLAAFEGWDAAREESRHIEHKAGKVVLSVQYAPKQDKKNDEGTEDDAKSGTDL